MTIQQADPSTTSTPAAPTHATPPDLSFLLSHTSHALITKMTAALAELGVTPRGFCVLKNALPGTLTQIQLAELSHLDKTTMVVTLDELEKAGLAERRPSPTDRRARIIVVTDAGRQVATAGQRIVDQVHRAVLEALPESERQAFVSALTRLASGYLSTPVPCQRSVRRTRQPRRNHA